MPTDDIQAFNVAKAAYIKARSHERDKIISKLLERGWTVMNMLFTKELANPYSPKAGRGLANYTSGGRMEPFDLSNWMWVNVRRDGCNYSVSLNADEIDPDTGHGHVLFDRLALSNYDTGDYVISNIDLPLDDDKLEELVDVLDYFVDTLST
ncbi:MAG: hypothetical protein LBC35_03045 [Coriobacteriales bacterium]|jgi:hypothetical protein|nr:hypothetical protein [Coriobacteriales bacterium]